MGPGTVQVLQGSPLTHGPDQGGQRSGNAPRGRAWLASPCGEGLGRPEVWSGSQRITAGTERQLEPVGPRLEPRTHPAEVTVPRAAAARGPPISCPEIAVPPLIPHRPVHSTRVPYFRPFLRGAFSAPSYFRPQRLAYFPSALAPPGRLVSRAAPSSASTGSWALRARARNLDRSGRSGSSSPRSCFRLL